MANYTDAQNHEFDRALLAVVSTDAVPYSRDAVATAYKGRSVYPTSYAGKTSAPITRLPDAREGDDDRLLVSVPTTHLLMEAKHPSKLHAERMVPARFKDALKTKYGLGDEVTVLSIPGVADRAGEARGEHGDTYSKPPEMMLLIKPSDLKKLAVQAWKNWLIPKKQRRF